MIQLLNVYAGVLMLVALSENIFLIAGFRRSQFMPITSTKLYGGGPIRADFLPKLIELANNSKRGLISTDNKEIISLIEEIASQNKK